MRDSGGELADRLHLLRLAQRRLGTLALRHGCSELRVGFDQFGGACRDPLLEARVEPREFLFGPLAAGDIEGDADQPRQLAIRATAPLATGAKPMDLAVWPD